MFFRPVRISSGRSPALAQAREQRTFLIGTVLDTRNSKVRARRSSDAEPAGEGWRWPSAQSNTPLREGADCATLERTGSPDLTESSVSWNSLPPGSYLVAEPGVRKGRHSYQDLFQSLGAVVISTWRSAHFAELLVIDG